MLAMSELARLPFDTAGEGVRNVASVMKTVSERMGNTPAICRKCYVDPALVDAYARGSLKTPGARRRPGLNRDEAAYLAFLRGLHRRVLRGRRMRTQAAPAAALKAAFTQAVA